MSNLFCSDKEHDVDLIFGAIFLSPFVVGLVLAFWAIFFRESFPRVLVYGMGG